MPSAMGYSTLHCGQAKDPSRISTSFLFLISRDKSPLQVGQHKISISSSFIAVLNGRRIRILILPYSFSTAQNLL